METEDKPKKDEKQVRKQAARGKWFDSTVFC
jgi:hypothetical protein